MCHQVRACCPSCVEANNTMTLDFCRKKKVHWVISGLGGQKLKAELKSAVPSVGSGGSVTGEK